MFAVDSIIHEQEAMRGQIEFLKEYATKWKASVPQKESDQNALSQLTLTTYYLKEGLQDLYGREDNFMLSKLELSTADEIKLRHNDVMTSLDRTCHELVDLSSKALQKNRESISRSIDSLCQLITVLSVQENEILKSCID